MAVPGIVRGDWLYNALVPTGIAGELEKVVAEFLIGTWAIDDEITIDISGEKPEKDVSVYTPRHSEIDDCWYTMDRRSRELIIRTSEGWKRTGYIVRLITHR